MLTRSDQIFFRNEFAFPFQPRDDGAKDLRRVVGEQVGLAPVAQLGVDRDDPAAEVEGYGRINDLQL